MGFNWTRPGLFLSIFYFLLLYALFRLRAHAGIDIPDIQSDTMPLGAWFVRFFEAHPLWNEAVLFILSLLNAYYITRILSQNLIYPERTHLPALIYGAIALGYTVSNLTVITLAVSFLLISAIDNMIRSYKKEGRPDRFLYASGALGLAPMLYAPAWGLPLLLPVGLLLFRQRWRSVVTATLGVLLPLFLCSYLVWGMGGDFGDTVRQLHARMTVPASGEFSLLRMRPWDYIWAGVFALLTIVALISLIWNRTALRRRSLRGHTIFIWTLVLCIALAALPGRGMEWLPIAAVPLAALIPVCFNRQSGWRPNVLYAMMLGCVIFYNLRFLL